MKKSLPLFSFFLLLLLTFSQTLSAQINEYFSISSAWNGAQTTVTFNGSPGTDIEYSTDKVSWTKITETTTIPTYNKTYFRGNNPDGFSKSATDYVNFLASGSSQTYYLEGNIMSLVNANDFATNYSTIPNSYCFYSLFTDKAGASNYYHPVYWNAGDLLLPADNLTPYCYASMFERTYIKVPPQLPAQHLAEYCYYKMFYTCISLDLRTSYPTTPIEYILPAEELAPHCYEHMFGLYNTNSTINQYITIMATSLQDRRGEDIQNCFKEMFYFGVALSSTSGKNIRWHLQIFFTNWGDVSKSTCPTYNWFGGNYNCAYNYFFYDTNLPWVASSISLGSGGVKSQFPNGAYSCETNNCTSFWVPEDYNYLTFDCKTNGGTWEADDDYNTDLRRVVRSNYTAKTVPANPHKLGCTFLGWFTAANGGTQVSEQTILSQTTAQTYYAQFIPNDVDFTVTIANGEHGHVVVTRNNEPTATYTTTSSVHNMSELTITAVPDAGYRFKAWTGDAATIKTAEDNGTIYYLVNDITVGATFEADECTVTISTPASNGTLAASDGTNNYVSGNTYTFNRQLDLNKVLTFTATPATHRLFTGFTGTALSNVTAAPYVYDQVVTGTYTITADTPDEVTVGATFTVPQFTVTATKTGRGNGSIILTADGYPEQTGSGTYDIDAVVTLTATPTNDKFRFVKWTDNDSDNPVRTYTVLGDATFEAEFDINGDLWSAPATVDVYANGYTLKGGTNTMPTTAASTNYRILYNLDPVEADDGITYTPVDMGAGVAWADKNIGATDPTKAGSYFYWGGTSPVTSVSNTTYYTDITTMSVTSSNTATQNALPAAKDAARQVMGENWRMPTYADMYNLVSTTYTGKYTTATGTSTSSAAYNYYIRNKYYADDNIFLPATGRYQTSGSSTISNSKDKTYLWTSTIAKLNGASSMLWHLNGQTNYGNNNSYYAYPWFAMPVRAVYVPKFETCTLTVIVYQASTAKFYYKYICEVGQTVTIKQHPNVTKYVFSAWRENTYSGTQLSTDNSYSVTLTGDQTIAAHYVSNNSATVLLTINAVPTKGGTADGGGYYVNGTNVTLTANPNENYRFVRWSDGNTTNPRAYTTTAAAVTLTAEFEYTGTASSADANEDVFAYMPTNCFKVLYDYPASMTGNDGNTYRLVDMGNGVLWANKNVGAADSTKAGSYFYWGGTTPVTTVGTATTWAGAQDMLLTTSYTTYSTLSPKVVQYALPADNDAATVKMGERWRMPTYEEVYYLSAPTGASETGAAASGYTYTNTLSGEKLFIPNSGYYKTNNSTTITKDHSLFWASTMGTYSATNSSCVAGYYYDGSATANSSTYGYIWYAMPVRGVYVPPFETCTIKVQVAGGAVIAGNTSATTYYRYYICEKGQKLRLTAHPHSVGQTAWTFAFTNWTDVTNGNAVLSTDPTYEFIVSEDKEIKATFASVTSNFSTIHALPLPRSAGYVYGVGRYKNGVTTQLHAVPEEGWTFVRWEDNNSTNPYREITVNGNASYNAVFTRAGEAAASAHKYVNVWHEATTTTTETLYDGDPLETCTLTVKTYESTTAKATYNYVCEKGQTVTVSAFTNTSNYSLLHWTNTNYDIMSYDPTVELEVNRNMTLYATFYTTRVTTRTLTLASTPLEGATFDGALKTNRQGVYEDGQVAKIICHPNPHYRFLHWEDDENNKNPERIVTVTADRTYTAVLEMDYDLTTVHSEDAFAQVYYGGTYQGTYLRYALPGYDANGYRPVDVGVGVAWANKNIGAADSTKAGDYFVWGMTTPATTVNSSGSAGTYYAGVTSMTTTAGYSTVPQNTLPAEADAATQIMGERWRMPNCTEIYNLQGVIGSGSTEEGQASAGYRYTNVENTSQFIYIPAAGCMKTSGSGTVTAGTTQFWGSTASTISGASSRPSYYLSGSYSAGTTSYYAWSAMPVRAVYVPPFETCSVKVVTNSKTYIYMCEVGQRITITAFYGAATATNQSYRVDKWVDQNNVTVCTDQTYSFIALSDVTLTVTYTSSYTTKRTLTFNVSPASSGTVNNLASFVGQYNDGAKVRIPVKAAANYRFSHWSDDVNNTDPNRVFTATANATYTAVFEPDPAQAVDARIAQAATADTTKILYPLPVLCKNNMFYTPVDMGTGTAWCDYNVGVTAPTSLNGGYYKWGGTSSTTSFRYNSGSSYIYTSVAATPFELPTGADAAYSVLGTMWRVPSKEQWEALVNNCSTGTANTFVNPSDATKTISLPSAGAYTPTTSNTSSNGSFTSGVACYWSRTLAVYNSTKQASQPWCYSNGEVMYGDGVPNASGHGYICYGMPVRAVYQPSFTPDTVRVRYTNGESVTRTNTYLVQRGQPVKVTAIPDDGYIFSKWSDDNVDATRSFFVTGNVTLTAEFAKKSENPIINFMSEDGLTKITWMEVEKNTVPVYDGEEPTKESTAEFDYPFAGWTDANDNFYAKNTSLPAATEDMDYFATFTPVRRSYTVTFSNWDGSTLQATDVEYGQTPSYSGTPTRPADAQYTYTFNGWDNEVVAVTGIATYTATYSNTLNSYTVTFKDAAGNTIQSGTLNYGVVPAFTGDIPVKESADPDYVWNFTGWTDGNDNFTAKGTALPAVGGTTVYTATYVYDADYLTLTNTSASNATVYFRRQSGNNSNTINIEWSINGGAWSDPRSYKYTNSYSITVPAGQNVRFRGNNTVIDGGVTKCKFSPSSSIYWNITSTNGSFTVSGNVMSLAAYDEENNRIHSEYPLSDYCFYSLFRSGSYSNFTSMRDASGLKLPATTLGAYCYQNMFINCTNLTATPVLPATTLAQYCYASMFSGCTSLTAGPALPAMTLANNCYQYMFSGCTHLTAAPNLPATTLTESCYTYMFQSCTALTSVPEALPGTNLPANCYAYMFSGCSALTTAPEIMAAANTVPGQGACDNMFASCTNLTKAPSRLLPTTVTNNLTYGHMFYNCTSLTAGPDIHATSVSSGGTKLQYMWNSSSSIRKIRVYFSEWGSMSFCPEWTYGVAATGDFYCPPSLARRYNNNEQTPSYIPTNWTVYSYDITLIPVGGRWADNTSAEKQFTWRTDKSDIDDFIAAQVDGEDNSLIQGWYLNAACTEATSEAEVKADLSVQRTAETKRVYVRLSGTNPTLLWDFNGGTTTSTEAEYTFGVMEAGDPITAPADPTRFGYTFMGWSSAQPADNTPVTVATVMPATDLIYTAIWQVLPTYLITANTGIMGTATLTADHYDDAEGSGSYIAGTQVTITVTPYFGYTFTGWSDSNTQNPRTITVGSTAATYTAQFDAMDEIDITMTEGTLDFPTYAKNSFAIIGENDQVEVRLHFGAAISTGNHLANFSTDLANSYIQPAGESKRQIASATLATVTYYGNTFRAARLVAKVTDTQGRKYNIDIYTNYCINYATFEEDYTYYYGGTKPTESSWVNGRSFEYGEDNYIGTMVIRPGNIMRYFLSQAGSDIYDVCQIQLQFYPDNTKPGTIPTGVYPINSTQAPGTVYIGAIPSNYLTRQSNSVNGYAGTGSWVFHDMENQSTYVRTIDNWVLRGGYVEVVNVDENYFVHVHAYTDGYKTNGEADNTVIDFTAGIGSVSAPVTATNITIAAQTTGGEQLAGAVTAAVAGASNWTDVTLGQGTHSLFSGNTIDLTAELDGYVFDHWELNGTPVAGEDYTYSYTVGAADAQIVAVFTLDNSPRYTITFEDEDGTQLQQLTVIENRTPVYTGATPVKAGWQFNGWTPAIVAATADATYTATYLPLFTLTTVTGGQGTVTLTAGGYEPAEGTGIYVQGTAVTMNVTAGAGASFAGWDDDNDGTVDNTQNPRTVTVTADKTYYVVFGLESADQSVSVYQAAAADTIRILYNLDAKTGLDGNTYIPVDLGYGVAWADRNVGATGTDVIGSYFRWGDPVASNTFNSSIHIDASGFSTGDKLSNSQDAAYVNMGSCWHMPDRNELLALKANTDLSNNNTFTNRTDNTKSIVFLAGGYKAKSHYDPDYQYYWSREYAMYGHNSQTNSNERTCFAFVRCTDNVYYASNYDKDDYYGNEYYLGMPVRAIYEPAYPTYTLTINVGGQKYQYICQAGQNITVTAVATEEGYVFDKWTEDDNTNATRTFNVTGNMSFTATFKEAPSTPVYDVTIETDGTGYGTVDVSAVNDVEEGTAITVSDNTLTINGTTVTATPAADTETYKYKFTGWTDGEGNTLPATVTADLTVRANFAREMHLVLCENCENEHYNDFLSFDGMTANTVTLNRQFTAGRWSTLCLPFSVNKAMFSTLNFGSRIYEFKYATGNANDGSGVNLYFSIAKSIEAGKGYIVNADAKLATRTSFVFPGVKIDLSADNGDELNSVTAYDNLTNGCSTEGNIELVGTLRKGTLQGTADGNTYMGLKENKIYYPNIATGSTILAYRGIFRSIKGTLNAERIRIIVDGEDMGELRIDKGEMLIDNSAEPRKFIENGVLYIERNGIIYDATGKRVELDK